MSLLGALFGIMDRLDLLIGALGYGDRTYGKPGSFRVTPGGW